MLGIILSFVFLFGLILAARDLFHLPSKYAPFFAVSLLGILQYIFAITNQLLFGTWFIIVSSFCFVALKSFLFARQQITAPGFSIKSTIDSSFLFYIGLLVLALLFAHHMQFHTIDDYVFWGALSKSIFINNHLPGKDTAIIRRHLTYTPGLSLIHTVFYQVNGYYSQALGYFSQNIVFVSALLVFLKEDDYKQSLFTQSLLLFLMIITFGSVLAKLQVDYLLAIYIAAILWVYYKTENRTHALIAILPGILFLFLIKEIGLYFSFVLLTVIALDTLITRRSLSENTIKKSICFFIVAVIGMILLKWSWHSHTQQMGFQSFVHALTFSSFLNAFAIFSNPAAHTAALLYLKSIFLAPANQFKLPYFIAYIILAILWRAIFIKLSKQEKPRYHSLLITSIIFLFIYLVMIYLLQVTVFKVGINYHEIIGFPRYMNMYFSGFFIFTLLTVLDLYWNHFQIKKQWVVAALTLCLIVVSVDKVMRTGDPDRMLRLAAQKIEKQISDHPQARVCVIADDDTAHFQKIKLLYYLLPHSVNETPLPNANTAQLKQALQSCEYLYLRTVNKITRQHLNEIQKMDYAIDSLYRVSNSRDPVFERGKKFRLIYDSSNSESSG